MVVAAIPISLTVLTAASTNCARAVSRRSAWVRRAVVVVDTDGNLTVVESSLDNHLSREFSASTVLGTHQRGDPFVPDVRPSALEGPRYDAYTTARTAFDALKLAGAVQPVWEGLDSFTFTTVGARHRRSTG